MLTYGIHTLAVILLIASADAQTVNFFRSRQNWLFALNVNGNDPQWCVSFTTNADSDFSNRVTVNVTDASNVVRFSLKAFGERLDENVISAAEDAAVMFVESGSLSFAGQDPVFVDLDLAAGSGTLGWGANIALRTQRNEFVKLEVTTATGVVSASYPVTTDGFYGFTARTGGDLRKIRFLALNDDNGAGGEIFVLDNVCGSSTLAPIPAPISPVAPVATVAPVKAPSKSPIRVPTTAPVPSQLQVFQSGNTVPAGGGQSENMAPQGGSIPGLANNVMCGAIQSVLAHPTNADICFAGATNGGVWRTTSCRSSQPQWIPLTDREDSLSIADMVFDESDGSGNTILVAIGSRSSFSSAGGAAIGLLLTQNALGSTTSWTVLDNAAGSVNFRTFGVQFRSVYLRGNLMLAAAFTEFDPNCARTGVFRSVNRGVTWTNVLMGEALEIANDPNNLNRFYAILDRTKSCNPGKDFGNSGVFTSNDGGATWAQTAASASTTPYLEGELNNAKISVVKLSTPATTRVWVALLKNGQADAISYSDNIGATWTKMDAVKTQETNGDIEGLNPREKPGSQGGIHFALLPDPANPNRIYVGGDRQDNPFPNFIGANDFSGRLFRGNAGVIGNGLTPSNQWDHLTHSNAIASIPGGGTASSSAPHADCRDFAFRADGGLLEADDGGITIRTNPADNTGDWFGMCGNMQTFESHSVAYSPVRDLLIFGNQDTGTIMGVLGVAGTYRTIFLGDGNSCMVDFTSDSNYIYAYYGSQSFNEVARILVRARIGKADGMVTLAFPKLPSFGSFLTPVAMNPNNQMEFSVQQVASGFDFVRTTNRGDNFDRHNSGLAGTIVAMAYSFDGMFLYLTNDALDVSRCNFAAVPPCVVRQKIPSTDRAVRRLAVDPANSQNVAAALTRNGQMGFNFLAVYYSQDGGSTWMDVTIPGSLVARAGAGGAVAYVRNGNNQNSYLLTVGTSNGVLIQDGGIGVRWKVLANGLPRAPVAEMIYDKMDDLLIVSTFGRGVWFLQQASVIASGAPGSFTGERIPDPNSGFVWDDGLKKLNDLIPPDDAPFVDLDNTPKS